MKYLLIAFIIAIVLSPLTWLRSTPGQVRVTSFRNKALQLGLKVQLVPSAEASEDEKRPDAVRYTLSITTDEKKCVVEENASWTLLFSDRRGWESRWDGWRWFRREAPSIVCDRIEIVLADIPPGTDAIRLDRGGVSLYWNERGDINDVERVAKALKTIKAALLN